MIDRTPHTERYLDEVARWAAMIGSELGLPRAQLAELEEAVRHGEKLEGQPQRILEVARAWQDLTLTMPRYQAVETLREGLGTQWDPQCVGALMWATAKVNRPPYASGGVPLPARAAARVPLGA